MPHRIDPDQITAATADFPDWLADDVQQWIEQALADGQQFTSPTEAVTTALAVLSQDGADR